MSSIRKKALVLTGDGINCERESAHACASAGFETKIVHINDLIQDQLTLDQLQSEFSVLFLPGGFSFGDELGSGRILSLKLRTALNWDLNQYAERGGLVLGACNGFQALIRMQVFGKDVSIAHNASGRFINRWVTLVPTKDANATSPWLKEMDAHPLPIRHGEGRILFSGNVDSADRKIALHYSEDVNGSTERIAGLTDKTGRILGLMPHPEAFVRETQHPNWTEKNLKEDRETVGLQYFRNAFKEATRS